MTIATSRIEFIRDDGGRAAAGYKGSTRDCSRSGTRCVYGYFSAPREAAVPTCVPESAFREVKPEWSGVDVKRVRP
jgi:hypothetical protein